MSIQGHLQVLKSRGFDPKTCIDIGAHTGGWASVWKTVFPQSKVLLIEPLESCKEELSYMSEKYPDDFEYEQAMLWSNSKADMPFYEMATGSSVYEETSYFPRIGKRIRPHTLTEVLEKHPRFKKPDFIKLDTQGSEMDILVGGHKAFDQAKALQIEASLIPVNEGAPLIAQIMHFMYKSDFLVSDICDPVRMKNGTLWQVDLIFVRRDIGLEGKPELTPETWG